jgi:hypothetical protein
MGVGDERGGEWWGARPPLVGGNDRWASEWGDGHRGYAAGLQGLRTQPGQGKESSGLRAPRTDLHQ